MFQINEELCEHDGEFEFFAYSGVRCKKCGHEARYVEYGLPDAFAEIAKKIASRDSLYEQTWQQVPLQDLISAARLKTFRAATMLQKNEKEKLLDDLIDAAAYLIFAIERLQFEVDG